MAPTVQRGGTFEELATQSRIFACFGMTALEEKFRLVLHKALQKEGIKSMANYPKLTFKYGWDDRDDEETPMKGYRSDGIVQSPKGEMYPVYFVDPIRLQQDLEAEEDNGSAIFAQPGLIILPEVNREAMENVVRQLWEQGYFEFLKPLKPEAEETKEKTKLIV